MSVDISKLLPILFEGFGTTLKIFGLTLLFSIPLGFIVSALKMCRIPPVRWIINAYILIMRGTPLILQIMFIYFAPTMLFRASASPDRFAAVIVAFSINYAAYFAEIFRGGIQSVPKGQFEAAKILGFNRVQTFFKITLPQVIKTVLPSVGNEVITLVKDTSLAQIIAVNELFSFARKQTSALASVMPLFTAGVFYFVFNWIVTLVFDIAEKKFDYYK